MPAFDEAGGIERAIGAASEAAGRLIAEGEIEDYEVVVVDDGSSDETASIVEKLAASDDRVRLARHDHNRGLGAALRTGFAEASGAWVLYTDADLPFDLFELTTAFRLMRHYGADVVAAYRLDRTGEGPRRLAYSYLYNSLVHSLVGLRLRDVNFAGKLVTRDVLDRLELHSEGSFIDVELLAKAQRAGFHIIQFGVDYFPRSRGVSTLSSTAVIRHLLGEMRTILPEIRAQGHRVRAR
ncbi:MAG: glycosyltransferase family 2 protein [Acidimicrobiales bacterium]